MPIVELFGRRGTVRAMPRLELSRLATTVLSVEIVPLTVRRVKNIALRGVERRVRNNKAVEPYGWRAPQVEGKTRYKQRKARGPLTRA